MNQNLGAVPSGRFSELLMQKQGKESTSETIQDEFEKQNHGRRILIVDGNPDVTFTFKVALENCGFRERVDTYNDPVLALANFRPQYYGLLFE